MSHTVHVETVHDVLSHQRRRYVLEYLVDRTSAVGVSEVAAAVSSREHDVERAEVPADRVDAVHLTLHHCHLPKLAEAGIVNYDPPRSTVRYESHPGVEKLLESHGNLDGVSAD